METPEACLTNVLKIANLSHIPYHVYIPTIRRPNPAPGNSPNPPPKLNLTTLRNGESHLRRKNIIGISNLERAELWIFDLDLDLPRDVQLDALGQDTLMAGSDGDRRPEISKRALKRLPDFPPEWGLRESREGIFLASSVSANDSDNRVKESFLGGTSAADAVDLTDGEHSESDPSLIAAEAHTDSPKTIYRYLITAILSTITYSYAKSCISGCRYFPLNIRTIAQLPSVSSPISTTLTFNNSPPTPPNSAGAEANGDAFETGRGGIMIFSLTAYLNTAGILCISATGRKIPRLVNLSFLVNADEKQMNAVKARDIWLAPWGGVGRILQLLSSSTASPIPNCNMTAQEARWAQEVRSYLADRGIELLQEEDVWVRVAVWLPCQNSDDRLHVVVWPAKACFIKSTEQERYWLTTPKLATIDPSETTDLTKTPLAQEELGVFSTENDDDYSFTRKIFDDDEYLTLGWPRRTKSGGDRGITDSGVTWFGGQAVDPLDFSEEWKLGASERDNVIKERQRQREQQSQLKAETLEVEMVEDLKGKGKEQTDFPENQKQTIHTVPGGVYPTPPDGQGQSSNPAGQNDLPPEPPSAASIDPGGFPDAGNTSTLDMGGTDIDMDWGDGQGHATIVGKGSGTDALSGIGGMGSLFNGMDDEDDIFTPEVTDKDFDFFDEPAFEPTLDGGMGLDLNSDPNAASTLDTTVISGAGNSEDLPDVRADLMMDFSGDSSAISLQDLDLGIGVEAQGVVARNPDFASSTVLVETQDPKVIEDTSQIKRHLHTPPLSPNRMLKLLLPEFARNSTPAPDMLLLPNTPRPNRIKDEELKQGLAYRRMSVYSPIEFTSNVELADRKYMAGGRFFVPPPKEAEKLENLDGKMASVSLLDSPAYKRRYNHRVQNVLKHVDFHLSQRTEITIDGDDVDMTDETEEDDGDYEYVTASSSESDEDDESELEYGQPLTVNISSAAYSIGMKRKRLVEDDGDLAVTESSHRHTPAALTNHSTPAPVGSEQELAPPPWQIMTPDPDDYPLADILDSFVLDEDSSSTSTVTSMTDLDYITVGKILSDQIITATLFGMDNKDGLVSTLEDDDDEEECLRNRRKAIGENEFEDVIRTIFTRAIRCTLQQYAELPGLEADSAIPIGKTTIKPVAQPRRTTAAKQPTGATAPEYSTSPPTFKIPPPHVHVHRGDMALEVSPVALKFWETFALGPCSGPKNVISFCIYAGGEAMSAAADEFMERMGTVYDSCRLGAYIRGNVDDIKRGLVAIQVPTVMDRPDLDTILQSFKETCIKFGANLANIADELQNIVVYVINPFSTPSALIDVCSSFLHLQRAYNRAMADFKDALPNNIVLQIVPMSFVATKHGLVTPPQEEYIRFALEVYNRCMATDSLPTTDEVRLSSPLSSSAKKTNDNAKLAMAKMSSSLFCVLLGGPGIMKTRNHHVFCFAPSITLAKPPPKAIHFKLSADFEPAIVQDLCLHVAYSQSADERWVSVAWTDNWGEFQANEAYCLGRKGCTVLRPWKEVCKDIWAQTVDFIKRKNLQWRVMIVKVGVMEEDEVQIWTSLSCESSKANYHTLTLLSADPCPSLSLTPILPPLLSQASNGQQNQFTTPASTPQPSTSSPDPSGASINTGGAGGGGGTPGDTIPDLDPDAQLIDYTDEVWGIVLSHQLPHSSSAVSNRRCRASGYLVKRAVTGEGDRYQPSVIEIGFLGFYGGSSSDRNHNNNNNSGVEGAGNSAVSGSSSNGSGKGREDLDMLRDVLGMFRGLVTLAQYKGVIDGASVEPWHVACVRKGNGVLNRLM